MRNTVKTTRNVQNVQNEKPDALTVLYGKDATFVTRVRREPVKIHDYYCLDPDSSLAMANSVLKRKLR